MQHILQVVPSKSTLPILSNILIEALEDKLKISATDLDVSITASIECNVSRKGSASLPAKILFDIVKEVPESEIVFEATGSRMEIKIPNGTYKIATVAADDYPKLPAVNTKKEISIDSGGLVKMIRKVSFACSDDETRPALNGVLWQTQGERMQMVATDGHRLARMSVGNSKLQGLNEDVIIPPKVLNLIPKFLESETREVGLIFGENNIILNLGNIILTSRLIEGPYPNFEQVIRAANNKKLVVSDLVNFPQKKVIEIKNTLVKLQEHAKTYVEMDDLYDLEGLEKVKRQMIAQLELLSSYYSSTKKYKTMGDYLEETRKFVKSESIALIVKSDGISINQAEKTVYASNYYKERVELMSKLKAFFINVEVMYNYYQNTLSSVVQSVSLCKKDNSYKYINNNG